MMINDFLSLKGEQMLISERFEARAAGMMTEAITGKGGKMGIGL